MSATVSPSSDTTAALNQPPPMPDHNAFAAHAALREALHREGGGWAEDRLLALGELAGNQQIRDLGRLANENPPVLRTFDRYGHRIDEVEFHPAWHELLEHATAHGLHALPWAEPQDGAHAARAAMFMTWNVEAGHGCPISMTYSAVPALRKDPELAAEWEPKMAVYRYDKRFVPAAEKESVLFGMAMTEKQGGSDVRANTTRAAAIGDGEYEIFGHKWFCSAPMCDAFLILAQADGGLTCFVLPRWKPDGSRNAFRLQRLKDKLGNRSNASSEVEFHGAYARRLGGEGRGVATIIEMVGHTRLDCVLGAAAGMRVAVEQAGWQVEHRSAFGKLLADQPLMRNVLADLALESEAATVTAMRLARSYDEPADVAFKRIGTAVAKYWTCKRAVPHAAEALECFGGNGYVEESGMPRLYREAPLNGIWEGSGNVISLDVLRALVKTPETFDAFFAEVEHAKGADPRLDAYVAQTRDAFADPATLEVRARRVVERMALSLQGSLMVRHAPPAVADAFVASRLDGDSGRAFGTLPAGVDFEAIIDRHRVHA
ncbi:MAG: acyl-CoA dehydrogenase family protein [Solirubrobacteraceae bacterium]